MMNTTSRQRIDVERKAIELLRNTGNLNVPVDVEKVAAALGAKIHYQDLEDQVSGVLMVKEGKKHIIINRAHPKTRQRFSIAHELGHLILHDAHDRLFIDTQLRVYQRVGAPTSSAYAEPGSSTTPEEEREANWFASGLLMPSALIEQASSEHELIDELDVALLASAFAVSEQAMSIRLHQLRVLTTSE